MDSRRQEYSGRDGITASTENDLLCETCAQSLKSDDAFPGSTLSTSPEDGKARLHSLTKKYQSYIVGSAQSEPRSVTLPLLPELSDDWYKSYKTTRALVRI
ncbi:uncharacterized protein EAE97_006724 [Botrytis byssoidea]|uniref:Uncharacterized protein n=1 Tax=Botrytis byssoidea TaxID=139641 RepID=A0A9P5II90_9HELO|nr:uncharacterized protein EAE97_006724 [Botrytis byssoidea]KAF7941887.1 hypothetical protein EAE97_006724 [Botrytis byssoidea]